MTLHLTLLLQDSTPSVVRDFGVYIADIAAAGAAGFAWRTNARLASIETLLMRRDSGVLSVTDRHGKTLTTHANTLARHDTRLDNHDDAIVRVNNELIVERRKNHGRREDDR